MERLAVACLVFISPCAWEFAEFPWWEDHLNKKNKNKKHLSSLGSRCLACAARYKLCSEPSLINHRSNIIVFECLAKKHKPHDQDFNPHAVAQQPRTWDQCTKPQSLDTPQKWCRIYGTISQWWLLYKLRQPPGSLHLRLKIRKIQLGVRT